MRTLLIFVDLSGNEWDKELVAEDLAADPTYYVGKILQLRMPGETLPATYEIVGIWEGSVFENIGTVNEVHLQFSCRLN